VEAGSYPLAFSPDGNTLATVWHATKQVGCNFGIFRAGKVIEKWEGWAAVGRRAAPFFSPDGTRLAVDRGTGEILLFTLPPVKKAAEKPPQK